MSPCHTAAMPTTVIIGGGVVGLNVALALSEARRGDIFLLECEKFLGHHTSARNSEVLHAGIAYPPPSLKAKLCVEGNRLSRELFDRLHVPYRKTGKWIVAINDAEAQGLHKLAANVIESGAHPLEERSVEAAQAAIPELARPHAVMYSPSTGMIDAAAYLQILDRFLSGRDNVNLVYPCAVHAIDAPQAVVKTDRGDIPYDWLINTAGLFADDIYRLSGGKRNFTVVPYKGEYYRWGRGTIKEVIYPVPGRFVSSDGDATKVSSLGIHLHRNVAGDLILGPSQLKGTAATKLDYSITSTAEHFAKSVAPFLKMPPRPEELEQAYAGNRPKLFEDGKPIGDFTFVKEGSAIHLLGIESPGLTAAPAIARYVLNFMS